MAKITSENKKEGQKVKLTLTYTIETTTDKLFEISSTNIDSLMLEEEIARKLEEVAIGGWTSVEEYLWETPLFDTNPENRRWEVDIKTDYNGQRSVPDLDVTHPGGLSGGSCRERRCGCGDYCQPGHCINVPG